MNREWTAKWIGPEEEDQFYPVIYKDFYVDDPVKKATLFIAALGKFEVYINGQRVGNEYLTPCRRDFGAAVPYYVFDVTQMLNCGPDSERNSIDIFLGDKKASGAFGTHRFAVKAELEVEVYKNSAVVEESFDDYQEEPLSEDIEEELESLLDDEFFETETISFLSMKGKVKTKEAKKPEIEDEVDDLDDFLNKMIDEDSPASENTVKDGADDSELDLEIFEFEDWDGLNLTEEEEKTTLSDASSRNEEAVLEDSSDDAVLNVESSDNTDSTEKTELHENNSMEEDSFLIEDLSLDEDLSRDEDLTLDEDLSLDDDLSLIMDEVQADASIVIRSEKEDSVSEEDDSVSEEDRIPETPELETDVVSAITVPASSELSEDEIEDLGALEEELELSLFSDEELEGLLNDSIFDEKEETQEEQAESENSESEMIKETENAEEESEAVSEDVSGEMLGDVEEETPNIALVGGLPFVVKDNKEKENQGVKAFVDEKISDAVDGITKADEEPVAEMGTLVGGIPLPGDLDADKAGEGTLKEWDRAASLNPEIDASLVGGLPFAVKPKAEAYVGSDLADAVDNVSKNEKRNIAGEGELAGGLAISEEALEGLPEEEKEEEADTVSLVGGLPFFIKDDGEEGQAFAFVDEDLSEAVDNINMVSDAVLPKEGTLVGGLPVQTENLTDTFVIVTDETWGYYASDIEISSEEEGEKFNRLLWENEDNQEKTVQVLDLDLPVAQRETLPVVIKETLDAQAIIPCGEEEFIIDFGQIFTGFTAFRSNLSKGTVVTLEYAEEFDGDTFEAKQGQKFIFVSDGVPEEVTSHFACFEGRFVKVTGWEKAPDPEDFKGCVLYSDMRRTGFLETSSDILNRMYKDLLAQQKRYSIRVPEDCNQRNVYSFAPAASFNMDTKEFLLTYLRELRSDGSTEGTADEVFIIWNLYMMYGEERILTENYELMKRWADSVDSKDAERGEKHYLYDFASDYNDLPEIDSETDPAFLASAYYYEAARLVAEAAKETGNSKDAFYYNRLSRRIKQAVLEEFFTVTGRPALTTQAACVTALRFGLYADKKRVLKALAERLEKDEYNVFCPQVETAYLCRTLAENGMQELAYDLLLNEKIEKGENAAEFLYTDLAGIKPEEPGFAKVNLSPIPDGRIQYCFSTFKTEYGDIVSNWNISENGDLSFHFEIPEGMTARIALPFYPVCAAGGNEVTVRSGSYDYTYMPSKKLLPED
ncbi:MAG: family 78 glycoside hydrolase catalytic domain [Parasporobacterium sp.]|nr:family 78 glycoside hydrolase catalytic domain [Parasporobacterium sp.]